MASEDQDLLRGLVRSISKRLEWEVAPAGDGAVRLTLRAPEGQASADLSRAEMDAALADATERNRLRERIKRLRKRIRDSRPPFMPWVLPPIRPIDAPGPRGWGGRR